MSTVYRCDRCKAEFSSIEDIAHVKIPTVHIKENTTVHDLCDKCLEHIRHEMSPSSIVKAK